MKRWNRRTVLISTVAAASAATTGAGIWLLAGRSRAKGLLRPPGALDEEAFLASCIKCGQCIQVFPTIRSSCWTSQRVLIWARRQWMQDNADAICATSSLASCAVRPEPWTLKSEKSNRCKWVLLYYTTLNAVGLSTINL